MFNYCCMVLPILTCQELHKSTRKKYLKINEHRCNSGSSAANIKPMLVHGLYKQLIEVKIIFLQHLLPVPWLCY